MSLASDSPNPSINMAESDKPTTTDQTGWWNRDQVVPDTRKTKDMVAQVITDWEEKAPVADHTVVALHDHALCWLILVTLQIGVLNQAVTD